MSHLRKTWPGSLSLWFLLFSTSFTLPAPFLLHLIIYYYHHCLFRLIIIVIITSFFLHFLHPTTTSPIPVAFFMVNTIKCLSPWNFRAQQKRMSSFNSPIKIYTFYLPLSRADRDWSSSSSCVPSEQKNVKRKSEQKNVRTNIWGQVEKQLSLQSKEINMNKIENEKVKNLFDPRWPKEDVTTRVA